MCSLAHSTWGHAVSQPGRGQSGARLGARAPLCGCPGRSEKAGRTGMRTAPPRSAARWLQRGTAGRHHCRPTWHVSAVRAGAQPGSRPACSQAGRRLVFLISCPGLLGSKAMASSVAPEGSSDAVGYPVHGRQLCSAADAGTRMCSQRLERARAKVNGQDDGDLPRRVGEALVGNSALLGSCASVPVLERGPCSCAGQPPGRMCFSGRHDACG